MERGNQYVGSAFLFTGHIFSAIADERAQMLGRNSCGHGVPWNDTNCRGVDQAPTPARVSTGDFGVESMQHGALDRVDGPGASQTLSCAAGIGTLAAAAIRYDSCIEKSLSEDECASAEGGDFTHQPRGGVAAI